MKKTATFLLPFLFICELCNAQNNVHYAKHIEPASSQLNTPYYELKPVKIGKKQFEVKSYYTGGHALYLKGISKDKLGKVLNGYATYYYKNGNKKKEGNYINGKEAGPWIYYDEDGSKDSEGRKVKGLSDGLWKAYFPKSEQIERLVNYRNGQQHGELTSYYRNGVIKRYEVYSNGEMFKGNCYTSFGDDTTYYPDRSQIRFPGGNEYFDEYVFKNTRFRGYWHKRGIKDKICIHAYFDEKGKVYNAVFEKRIDPIADQEALRIIMNMPSWEPAEDDKGKRIKSEKNLELMF